jgi:hypothetical protein
LIFDLEISQQEWKPEMPERVGIYHAYVRGFNKDTRSHKLFIVTSGGCTAMSDAYFNLFVDVRNHMKVQDVVNSEETWFLRNACRRNNARILLAVARYLPHLTMRTGVAKMTRRIPRRRGYVTPLARNSRVHPDIQCPNDELTDREFGLDIPTVTDTYDCNRGDVASCTTETMHFDVSQEEYNRYSMCSMCTDTTRCNNGILFSMHPAEVIDPALLRARPAFD